MRSIFKSIVVAILLLEAKIVLSRKTPTIIAVTGSVGKTTTKDAIATVLATTFSVRASKKSFNSELGIPLTILGLDNAWNSPIGWFRNIFEGLSVALFPGEYPKMLVLEVGADKPNDIRDVSAWLKPHAVVITRIPETPVHVENFPSKDAIKKEKGYLASALRSGGALILNADDKEVLSLRGKSPDNLIITFGFGDGSAMKGSHEQVWYEGESGGKPVGMQCKIDFSGSSMPLRIRGSLGLPALYSSLAALAVGSFFEVNLVEATSALAQQQNPPGRMAILPGIAGSTLIDDTYNASPVAMLSALDTLREIRTDGRKIAVLGDMLELGQYSRTEHIKLGAVCAPFVDMLLTVGERGKWFAEGARNANLEAQRIHTFPTSDLAGKWLSEKLRENDIVLLKGSQGSGGQKIRMEQATKLLLADPTVAGTTLVRQEAEWQVH